jgi:hypothetical protein
MDVDSCKWHKTNNTMHCPFHIDMFPTKMGTTHGISPLGRSQMGCVQFIPKYRTTTKWMIELVENWTFLRRWGDADGRSEHMTGVYWVTHLLLLYFFCNWQGCLTDYDQLTLAQPLWKVEYHKRFLLAIITELVQVAIDVNTIVLIARTCQTTPCYFGSGTVGFDVLELHRPWFPCPEFRG